MVTRDCGQASGPDVLVAAADYILSRDAPRQDHDGIHYVEIESRLQDIRSAVTGRLSMIADPGLKVTDAVLDQALSGIRISAKCRGLPYAAVKSSLPASRRYHKEMQTLAIHLGMAATDWTIQDDYHVLKPARPPDRFSSYRVLGLNPAEGRLQEEVWVHFAMDAVWAHVGACQDARKDSLAVMLVECEASAVRDACGLPHGTIWADLQEAFDSTWKGDTLVRLHDKAGVNGKLFAVADAKVSKAKLRIVKGAWAATVICPGNCLVEGTKLAPGMFCLEHSAFDEDFH
jgi:hypothetical protein